MNAATPTESVPPIVAAWTDHTNRLLSARPPILPKTRLRRVWRQACSASVRGSAVPTTRAIRHSSSDPRSPGPRSQSGGTDQVDTAPNVEGRRLAPKAERSALTVAAEELLDGFTAAHTAHHLRAGRGGIHPELPARGGDAADFLDPTLLHLFSQISTASSAKEFASKSSRGSDEDVRARNAAANGAELPGNDRSDFRSPGNRDDRGNCLEEIATGSWRLYAEGATAGSVLSTLLNPSSSSELSQTLSIIKYLARKY